MTERTLGVCYYPEHWPEDALAGGRRPHGRRRPHLGPDRRVRLEPARARARRAALRLARPRHRHARRAPASRSCSARRPRRRRAGCSTGIRTCWRSDRQGRPRGFGSRRHYCFSHDGYRAEARRIARLLAERYGANPHVAAWQIDNEYGCHDTALSWSPAALAAFRAWLAAKYGEIGALNAAWGNVFWSMEYRGFDEIEPAEPHGHRAEPGAPARLPPLLLRPGRRASTAPRSRHPRRTPGLPLLHNYMARDRRVRPLRRRRRPRCRELGQLPARLPRGPLRRARRLEAPPTSARATPTPGLPPRPLPRRRPRPLLDHGAAARPGELGALQPGAARRHGAALDVGGLRPRRRGRSAISAGARRPSPRSRCTPAS